MCTQCARNYKIENTKKVNWKTVYANGPLNITIKMKNLTH